MVKKPLRTLISGCIMSIVDGLIFHFLGKLLFAMSVGPVSVALFTFFDHIFDLLPPEYKKTIPVSSMVGIIFWMISLFSGMFFWRMGIFGLSTLSLMTIFGFLIGFFGTLLTVKLNRTNEKGGSGSFEKKSS